MSLAELPVPNVPISKKFVVSRAIKPDVGSEATLEVVFPVSLIFFLGSEPVHGSMTVSLIVSPFTFVKVATSVSHLSLSPLHTSLPLPFVNGSIFILEHALAVSHAVNPFTFIFNSFLVILVNPLSMSESILNDSAVS